MTYTTNLVTTGVRNDAATIRAAKAYVRSRNAKRLEDVDLLIETFWERAPLMGIRPEVPFGQFCDETAVGTSWYWEVHLNPGGLRITYAGEQSRTWKNGRDAALGMLHRLSLYIFGKEVPEIRDGAPFDPLPEKVTEEGYLGVAKRLRDLAGRWAENPNYAVQIAEHLNLAFPDGGDAPGTETNGGGGPVADLIFGKVERPAMKNLIVNKPWDGAGFYRVAPRDIVGVCDHITDGNGTIEWYAKFFGTGGERQYDALVDLVIDREGRIGMLNDPYGTRAPWANGGSDGLEGDGPLFTRLLGVGAINARLVSKEHVGVSPQPMTAAQMEASCRVTAYYFDQDQVPYTEYPFNPGVQCVTHMEHWEFATKPCPGSGMRAQINERQDRTRAILKAAQEQVVVPDPGVPPVHPPKPDHNAIPGPFTADELANVYGVLQRRNPGGSLTDVPFDLTPGRGAAKVISNAWVARFAPEFKKAKNLPKPLGWYVIDAGEGVKHDLVLFQRDYALWRPDPAVAWQWIR